MDKVVNTVIIGVISGVLASFATEFVRKQIAVVKINKNAEAP